MQRIDAPAGASFAYQVAKEALEDQLRRIDGQDAKAGILLAAAGVLAGLLLSGTSQLRTTPDVIVILGGLLLLSALILALLASLNRRYDTAPRPTTVSRMALRDEEWLKWRFLANVHQALALNSAKLERKTQLLTWAQICLLAAIVIIGGSFIVGRF
ncbi:MAG: hypothetical protein ACRDK3_18140 [Actinomycetota bacterium]